MDGLFACSGHYPARQIDGFFLEGGMTLVELLVVVACLGLLSHVALPSFNDYLHRNRLKTAVEDIYGLLMLARTEGAVRDRNLSVAIHPEGTQWCMGLADAPTCDCTQEMSCTLPVAGVEVHQVLLGLDYPGVTITANFPTPGGGPTFNRIRGNTSGGTVAVFAHDWEAQIRVTPHGRIRVCAPTGGIKNNARLGYPFC